MGTKKIFKFLLVLMAAALMLAACAPAAAEEPAMEEEAAAVEEEVEEAAPAEEEAVAEDFVFGILMVGVYNNKGWDQAHYDAGLYVEEKAPGTSMIYIDKVNSADRPGTTAAQLAEELVSKGANLIIFNSDDMKDSAVEFATAHPDVDVIFSTGDTQWAEGENYQEFANMKNVMGRMEYGKMIAGCAAALTSETGKIGYLGPLINEETRRLTASAYLGAEYCWENYAGKDPADLTFEVNWIGFWFNIPGVTLDPTTVTDEFFNSGYDVVISALTPLKHWWKPRNMRMLVKPSLPSPMTMKALANKLPKSAWVFHISTGAQATWLLSMKPCPVNTPIPGNGWDRIGQISTIQTPQ